MKLATIKALEIALCKITAKSIQKVRFISTA